ncbi:Na+/H+ antiporter subunit E [Propionibacteriaceae bacterium Y2011]
MTDRRNGLQYKTIIALTVVWVLLWGELSILNVLIGLIVGLVITLVFPLPPISFHGRLRPLGALWLGVKLVLDLVVASLSVVGTVFHFGKKFDNAVIRVPLRSHSDLYMTIAAELTCLVPGSVVIEASRSTDTLYVHVMDVSGPEDLEAAKQAALDAEIRVLKALGSNEELECLRTGAPMPRPDNRDKGPGGEEPEDEYEDVFSADPTPVSTETQASPETPTDGAGEERT